MSLSLEIIGGLIREASKSEKDLMTFEADTTATREKLSQALKVATAKACEACFVGDECNPVSIVPPTSHHIC